MLALNNLLCACARNALHLAARSCNVDMLRLLVGGEDAAADAAYVNEPDRNGITALFLAMQKGAARPCGYRAAQQRRPAQAGGYRGQLSSHAKHGARGGSQPPQRKLRTTRGAEAEPAHQACGAMVRRARWAGGPSREDDVSDFVSSRSSQTFVEDAASHLPRARGRRGRPGGVRVPDAGRRAVQLAGLEGAGRAATGAAAAARRRPAAAARAWPARGPVRAAAVTVLVVGR